MDISEVIKSKLGQHQDFPKKGILFFDIFPIFRNPLQLEALVTAFLSHIFSTTNPQLQVDKIDLVVGLDARGFLLGPLIAQRLNVGFVPIRKQGKLPGECIQAKYEKEYGADVFEMQKGAIEPGQSVLVIDDLIATGGSCKAAGELVSKSGGKVLEYLFCIEIPFLKGRDQLDAPAFSIVQVD